MLSIGHAEHVDQNGDHECAASADDSYADADYQAYHEQSNYGEFHLQPQSEIMLSADTDIRLSSDRLSLVWAVAVNEVAGRHSVFAFWL